MSPDNFLTQHRIRYDGIGVQATPAEYVAALQLLSATREVDDGELSDVTYHTQGFVPAQYGPNSYAPAMVEKERKAVQAYLACLPSGDLSKVHAAVDAINAVRAAKGGTEFVPQSDFEILAHANGPVGQVARFIASERLWVEETGYGSMTGSPLPWFDTVEAFRELAAYSAA